MTRRSLPLSNVLLTLVLFASLAIAVQAQGQKLIKFDAPGAGTDSWQGTISVAINLQGTILGNFVDANWGTHGYVRTLEGEFATFDAPGADPVNGCTCPNAINNFGVVVGYDLDTNSVSHGFLRTPNGTIATIDDPNAGTGANQGTALSGINDFGLATGYYTDANNVNHSFLRSPNGRITTFSVPGEGTDAYQGTIPYNINNFGAVAGIYVDSNNVSHGFLLSPDGKAITVDPPGAVGGPYGGVYNAFVNDGGVIAGSYFDANTSVEIGFIRALQGGFTTFKAPKAGSDLGSYEGTGVESVNVFGAEVGYVVDSLQERHSFVRTASGKVTTFDIPGQLHVQDTWLGSQSCSINAMGQIAGRWRDPNYVAHGYLLLPED